MLRPRAQCDGIGWSCVSRSREKVSDPSSHSSPVSFPAAADPLTLSVAPQTLFGEDLLCQRTVRKKVIAESIRCSVHRLLHPDDCSCSQVVAQSEKNAFICSADCES